MSREAPRPRLRALLVDDDVSTLSVLAALLEDEGWEVEVRDLAIGTAAHVQKFKPDVVVLDVHMPALRGDRLAQMLTARDSTESVPVVFHSARPAVELAAMVEAFGAVGFIEKSGDHALFATRLSQLVAPLVESRPPLRIGSRR